MNLGEGSSLGAFFLMGWIWEWGDNEIRTFAFSYILFFAAGVGRNKFSPVFCRVSRIPGGILNNLFSV